MAASVDLQLVDLGSLLEQESLVVEGGKKGLKVLHHDASRLW